MSKGKDAGGKHRPVRKGRTEADVEATLDSIDEALLTGNAQRIQPLVEKLWPARRQVPEILTRRIMSGRAAVPAVAFEILGLLAGVQAVPYLKRIAQERTVPDIVRFGAQRRAGWPEQDEAKRRLAFLRTLKDAEGTLVEAVEQATATQLPQGEILEDVLGYLGVLPPEQRHAVAARVVNEQGAQASWLVEALLHVPDPSTQRLALGELVRLHVPGAAGPIGRLAKTAQNPEIRREAAAAAQRLGMYAVGVAKPVEPVPLPPVERVLLSIVDGDGGQVVLVVRRWEEGVYLVADAFHNDHWGIKDTFGSSHMMPEDVEDIVADLKEEGIDLVEVELSAVRGVLAAAVEVNDVAGHGIPPAFELWEPFMHDSYPPPDGEPIVVAELDDAPYAERDDLIRASRKLADHPWFASWVFDPMRSAAAMLSTPPPKSPRWTDQQYRPLIEQLVDSVTCAQFRRRLRRQAWLLERSGDTATRDLALAVAAQLSAGQTAQLVKQPFLRIVAQRSVAAALEDVLFDQ